MSQPILTVSIAYENDVVLARQRARQIASLLGFDKQDQVRIATAVSEIARNAFHYGRGGKVEFSLGQQAPQSLDIRISDQGPGIPNLQAILDGNYTSPTGLGLGVTGARRLMDGFEISSNAGQGTTILLCKKLGRGQPPIGRQELAGIAARLAQEAPGDALGELRHQNQELLGTLTRLEERTKELANLNHELEDTNRGVVALYAELDERADSLRRASELKSHFLSNMTHEFRTPLNSILSLSRMLLDRLDGELTPEQEKQVRFIEKGAQGLSELVNDLLDLAKVEAGKITIRPSEFTVADLFGALRGMLRPLLSGNSSVSLNFEEPVGIPPLRTDESKVSQILRNFISNALKFTERGEIRVSVQLGPDDHVTFSVTDTGVGIAPEDQSSIFEEFVQIEGAHQKGKRGTGLGLPLSKKLAFLLGGSLSLRSEAGIGSTFSVTLPLVYQGPSEAQFVPEIARELDPTRLPVLLVEDNPETLFVYEKFFKGTGFQPVPARTLKEAGQAMEQFRPIAIVLDILLSTESSWNFLSEIKGNAATKGIPVYVVTMVDNRQMALAMGADDFCIKPVDRTWLLQKLNGLTALRSYGELLIIDDDEVWRYVLKGLLGETYFRVSEASGGAEGLQLARARKPAAIFLDLVMPEITGFEVLRRLKADPETAEIPVIVHTAKLLSDEERARLSPHVAAIIAKDHAKRENSILQIRRALCDAGLSVKRAYAEELHDA